MKQAVVTSFPDWRCRKATMEIGESQTYYIGNLAEDRRELGRDERFEDLTSTERRAVQLSREARSLWSAAATTGMRRQIQLEGSPRPLREKAIECALTQRRAGENCFIYSVTRLA